MGRPTGVDWDAQRYHRVAQPHAAWGANVLDRLRLRGDEVVLDAGCGSGRVSAQLLERLPNGRLIGVDNSPAMLTEARTTLAAHQDRVRFIQANLLDLDQSLEPSSVDAIFSTATFHWIDDHQRLFNALRSVARPGAQLVSQFGGGDNLSEFMRATDAVASQSRYASYFEGKALWRFYYSPDQTRDRLEAAGFTRIETWLEPSPQTFADQHTLADFARAVVLRNHVGVLPEPLQADFIGAVTHEIYARLGDWTLDYVRLNADAEAA
jgi:trans-aconitate 2-methyltransferase